MHFYHRSSCCSDGLHILILRLPARPFSVWWQDGCSSLLYPYKTVTVGFPPIFIYFYKVYLNTLDVLFFWLLSHFQYVNLLEGSAPILRVLFSLDVFEKNLEESLKWSANFLNIFRARWRLCPVQYLRGYPLLPLVLQVSYRSSGGASFWGISIVPCSP